MIPAVPQLLGGIGLFLAGMAMMTEGLRALAGERLRRILRRSTSSPLRGAVAGALTTAMVQSSSATTVAAVGFVAAGLMSFEQSLGIIFGANIGTTITGWLVAILGIKLDLGTALMPAVLGGVLMRLYAPGAWRDAGWSLAGFGVLFIGIGTLQQGMAGFADVVSPASFPSDTFLGRLELVAIGIAITVVTQSSSAGVAAALAALASGTIAFPQAAALVIGMDVGTTFTAVLAALGGSTATRRTGYSHVIYNLMTGVMAFLLLTPLGWLAEAARGHGVFDAEIWLVAFHSSFNFLGVVLVLGVTDRFARLVMRLVPGGGEELTGRLDRLLLTSPRAAVDAGVATLRDIAGALFTSLGRQLSGRIQNPDRDALERVQLGIDAARGFAEAMRPPADSPEQRAQVDILHALDHLERLRVRAGEDPRIDEIRREPRLRAAGEQLAQILRRSLASGGVHALAVEANTLRRAFRDDRDGHRERVIRQVAEGRLPPETLTLSLDAMRWLHRSAYHVWRILEHLAQADTEEQVPPPDPGAVEGGDEAAAAAGPSGP